MNSRDYIKRRKKLAKVIGKGSVAILPAAQTSQRSRDTKYKYRPDSDFYYYTGFSEPESLMILAPGRSEGEFILLVEKKDPLAETWEGHRPGPKGAIKDYGADQLRYFLMRETPFGNDGNYSHELITNRVNADLANDLGNLAQRILTMVWRNCDSKIPKATQLRDNDKLLLESIPNLYEKLGDLMKNYQISIYISSIFEVISLTNKYISNEKPWELNINNQPRMNTVLWIACEMLRNITILLQPILVSSSSDLLDTLGISEKERSFKNLGDKDLLKHGTKILEPKIIFPKLEL